MGDISIRLRVVDDDALASLDRIVQELDTLGEAAKQSGSYLAALETAPVGTGLAEEHSPRTTTEVNVRLADLENGPNAGSGARSEATGTNTFARTQAAVTQLQTAIDALPGKALTAASDITTAMSSIGSAFDPALAKAGATVRALGEIGAAISGLVGTLTINTTFNASGGEDARNNVKPVRGPQ
ncbi:MAG TPA: hypothetical protein VMT34_11785 [Aggregatilineales bacterium]|nr:hypothetical protein [Aggregatilineales bacterium]